MTPCMGDILDNLVNQKPKILKGLLEQGFPQSRLETLVSEDYLAMEEGDETEIEGFFFQMGWGRGSILLTFYIYLP